MSPWHHNTAMQLDGSPDSERVVLVANYVRGQIDPARVHTGYMIVRDRRNIEQASVFCVEGPPWPSDRCEFTAPDILITDRGRPVLAIEIDGSVHQTTAGRKHDDRRRARYERAGVRCLIVDYDSDDWMAEIDGALWSTG